ncbi:hypothetical protein NP493_3g03006 [Ridgeia piscesae]|uniref:Uncharacterized protein n=1 Tax=Ridgeia piscesae TaxID=27915 RepID=A0AAD9PG92_RIDPI|nr:hypothetical protein NP493_3g03006 [Ridgeia piscesae]
MIRIQLSLWQSKPVDLSTAATHTHARTHGRTHAHTHAHHTHTHTHTHTNYEICSGVTERI